MLPLSLQRDDDDATGGKSFNIYRPSLPTPLAPSEPDTHTGTRAATGPVAAQSEFVMARAASRKILEYDAVIAD